MAARPLSPDEVAGLFNEVFVVDVRGRRVLEHLQSRWCRGTPVVTSGGIDAILQTYRHAAHREVIDYIHALIQRASAEPSETPTADVSKG